MQVPERYVVGAVEYFGSNNLDAAHSRQGLFAAAVLGSSHEGMGNDHPPRGFWYVLPSSRDLSGKNILGRQDRLVREALTSCKLVGEGETRERDRPMLVIQDEWLLVGSHCTPDRRAPGIWHARHGFDPVA